LAEAQQRVSGAFGGGDRAALAKAEEAIDAAAGRIRDEDPTISAEKAIDLALKRAPELYSVYQLARHADGRDIGERASASVSKGEPVQLSKAARSSWKALDAYMSGHGPRPWPSESERVQKSDKDDDAEFEQRLESVLKEASSRGLPSRRRRLRPRRLRSLRRPT
jgi:hypothetical protein